MRKKSREANAKIEERRNTEAVKQKKEETKELTKGTGGGQEVTKSGGGQEVTKSGGEQEVTKSGGLTASGGGLAAFGG